MAIQYVIMALAKFRCTKYYATTKLLIHNYYGVDAMFYKVKRYDPKTLNDLLIDWRAEIDFVEGRAAANCIRKIKRLSKIALFCFKIVNLLVSIFNY